MADQTAPDDRLLVVPDVNAYLDVARLVGEPFSWAGFDAVLAIHASEPNPHPTDAAVDSLRALAALRSGSSPAGVAREVWTSNHIIATTAFKAHQDSSAADPRDRGLGWSLASAQQLVDELIWGLVDFSDGDNIGDVEIAYGSPPLDHEDGLVFATAHGAGFIEVDYYHKVVITRDRGFASATLPGLTEVMHPATWLSLHRGEERTVAFKRLLGR